MGYSDFSLDISSEKIYDSRTREYFKEVLGSYINGYYRSSTVMLWSVVISDLAYKLQNLRDLYGDQTATSILSNVEQRQLNAPTNPEWETILLDEINQRMNFFEGADYQNITQIKMMRHLSAHPVLSSVNLLFSPNKDTTRALIRSALEAVLLKPPIFSKRIIGEFVSDVAQKKSLLLDEVSLKKYLDAKYFRGLHPSVEQELIKALWKFCFRIINADTELHRDINIRCLNILLAKNIATISKLVSDNREFFSEISTEISALIYLIFMLSEHPALYHMLTDAAQIVISNYAKIDVNIHARSIFLSPDAATHIQTIFDDVNRIQLNQDAFDFLVGISKDATSQSLLNKLAIKMYVNSGSFDTADKNFAVFIAGQISGFDISAIQELLAGIEANNQTHYRGKSRDEHALIVNRANQLSGGAFDLQPYPNFQNSLR